MRVEEIKKAGFVKASPEIEVALVTPDSVEGSFFVKELEHTCKDSNMKSYVYIRENAEKSSMGIINMWPSAGSREEIMKFEIE